MRFATNRCYKSRRRRQAKHLGNDIERRPARQNLSFSSGRASRPSRPHRAGRSRDEHVNDTPAQGPLKLLCRVAGSSPDLISSTRAAMMASSWSSSLSVICPRSRETPGPRRPSCCGVDQVRWLTFRSPRDDRARNARRGPKMRGAARSENRPMRPKKRILQQKLDYAVRCNHSDRLILEETQHGPIHRRLPVRQRPNCGVGYPIPGRHLSLSRLPQTSWRPFSRFRDIPSGCGDDRWRNTRLRRAVFLSPLRLIHFCTHRRRNRSERRIPGCP